MELIITRGIPGAGKSTWARAWVADDPEKRVRVNRDDLRFMLFGKYYGVNELAVTAVEVAAINAALRGGQSVVVDATHLHPGSVPKMRRVADRHGATLVVKDFEIDVAEAIRRDAARSRSVGADVIRMMAGKRAGLLTAVPSGAS